MTDLFFYLAMRMLIANEGFEAEPYKIDDVWHIGYGRNLEVHMPNPICENYSCLVWPKEYAFNQLSDDVKRINKRLEIRYSCYKRLPTKARVVLIDLSYNLGINGLFEFKDLLVSLCLKDYTKAGRDLLDSDYANQLPNRSARNAEILKNGINNLY